MKPSRMWPTCGSSPKGRIEPPMRIGVVALIITACAASLPGCATQKAAWDHYDDCAKQNLSFVDMVACGKQRRTAFCEANHSCEPAGDEVVAYADSLAKAVSRHEMTEAEAKRKWSVYITGH
jgi:hypothetical protein